MAEVTLSAGARRDLTAIGDYIARDNPARAESFVAELHAACLRIGNFPRSYSVEPRHGPDARRLSHGNYIIHFDVIDDDVRINAIVHAARNF